MIILGKEIDLNLFKEAGSALNKAPAVSQAEAVSHVANAAGGVNFTTQTAKAVESAFALTDTHKLVGANDAFAVIADYLTTEQPALATVATTGAALLQNLPFLNQTAFKNRSVVIHAQLTADFSPVTSLRDLGLPILVSQTAQEAQDLALVAYAYAAHAQTTVLHFFAPSEAQKFNLIDSAAVQKFIQATASSEKIIDEDAQFDTLASLLHNVGKYKPYETVSTAKNPTDAIFLLGEASESLSKAVHADGSSILLSIRLYRPISVAQVLASLPLSVKTLTVVEQSSHTQQFSPLLLDLFADSAKLFDRGLTKVVSTNFGVVSDHAVAVATVLGNTRAEKPIQNLTVGAAEQVCGADVAAAQAQAQTLESAYITMLQQVNDRLTILNAQSSDSIGDAANPEFGYGAFLNGEEQKKSLVGLVQEAVRASVFSASLTKRLSEWLVQGKTDSAAIISALEAEADESKTAILALSSHFTESSSWIVGSDSWSYDLGSSGVHHLVSSGKNLNMLIIDSEPQATDRKVNGFRKKDVGLYAMNFGGCYVASVAVYASYTQVLQAFIEAEKFEGPSIVMAYLPYHSESDDTLAVLQETKRAVDSGYWPLYRYSPNETEPFKLDSSSLKKELKDFLDRENKLTLLALKNPVLARTLVASQTNDVKEKQEAKAKEAYAQLLEGLSGPPVTVAFASDGGNAEGLAKRIGRQALGRGLKATVLAMDDIPIEDLSAEENVIFVTSTAGQGEFPQNGKTLWDGLKGSLDLDLTGVNFSVFGLGDSQYWPRKEDAHYYNKPCKDLFAKLAFFGAGEIAPLGLGDDQDADGYSTGYNVWIEQIWEGLGVAGLAGVEEPKPLTNEDMKLGSDYLRGTIVEGLQDQSTGAISAVDQQLTKFHGIYMQDDRDVRDQRKADGLEPAYSFMVRVRLAGGVSTPQQYLKMDELSNTRGNGTLKVTTRATFQLHGVVKHDLKPAIRGMNAALMDTLAACGDVNRNVMCSALPGNRKVHSQINEASKIISEHLLPQTTAYHEIWLEGADAGDKPGDSAVWENRVEGPTKKKTLVAGNALADVEPMYKNLYLPRKFKIVITVPPFNDVDVYAHDIGLIAIVNESDVVIGYNVLAGGGMGTTHNNKKTYPRAGSMMGYCSADKIHIACEKIMLVQRDNGDRTNRKHARLKYTIDDMGVEAFKTAVEEYWGERFEAPREFEIKSNIDYFGWAQDETGLHHFTCFIENGRIEDTPELPQKQGLKEIAEYMVEKKFGNFRLTGNQHFLISDITDEHLDHVKGLMKKYKLDNTNFSALRMGSSACVAFPTCGLAMAESERYLPVLVSKLEGALEEYGLRHDSVTMRMTGCPNGCARPWLAEVALVGKAFGAYNLLLGGGYHGQRLNKIYRYSIKEDEILDTLKPLFKRWALERHEGEHFGDFVIRVGVIKPTLEGKYFHDDIPEEA
ncbi:hypothetical protein BABINDRAFT_57000 [Babjeviella inositovora NRRL Y-12698]|uniref:assimilatory sulfite reductase (NADPH) n=1 Tax=Babjeviella inositovora NRRL Y-12698 TaxID=984486 RepID=A0A1E3QZ59_9ASCO|nr:uncharacterized protein BABINDRAFT_57000 [Babjeviella inositovora NRRL Y-12698]ODQ82911.1 hypothetical protein BABINDRAFT_57000 [Babjeviella inositovora NRRL Y-12698]